MTFAETLNQAGCSCGVEDGYHWFTDAEGDETSKAGDYVVSQTHNGPRVWQESDGRHGFTGRPVDGKPYEVYGVEGFDKDGKRCVALYNLNGDLQWTDYNGEPKESDDDFDDDFEDDEWEDEDDFGDE